MMCLITSLLVAAASPGSFAAAAENIPGLVALWPMDGNLDAAKGGLKAAGAPAFGEGVLGKAVLFDGTNFAAVNECPQLDTDHATVAFFFRLDALPDQNYNPCLVGKRQSSPDTRFSVHLMKAKGSLAMWNGRALVTADPPLGPVKPGEWHHFAATAGEFVTRIYVDGVLCATFGERPRKAAANLPLIIGASSPAGEEKFTGAIDELVFYDRALSSEEIASLVDAAGWKDRRVCTAQANEDRLEERQRKIDERRGLDAESVAKRLQDPALTRPGETRVYTGDNLTAISLPVGGIGTGIVQYNGNAEPYVWQIFNNYKWVRLPETYMAIRAETDGQQPVVRALQTAPVGSFPAMEKLEFRGEYPFGWFDFIDPALPVKVSLEVFNPLVPLNAADSALPCLISNVTVTNTSEKPVEVNLLSAQLNPVGFTGNDDLESRKNDCFGNNVNTIERHKNGRMLLMTADPAKEAPGYGDVALLVLDGQTSACADWPVPDAACEAFSKDAEMPRSRRAGPAQPGETIAGAVATELHLKPGETKKATFILAWYFPHVVHGAPKQKWNLNGNMYANWFENAAAVAKNVADRLDELTAETRTYHDTMYASNLPRFLLDRVTSQIAVLRSPTCFWARDGYFGGWEGCNQEAGCCHGNCGHVWQYAQSHARLFPSLARRMREEALAVQEENGALPFRQPNFIKAVDAQCGEILALYREHLCSADADWLRPRWPRVKKAMEYTIAAWDPDENGALSGVQHNTLDINVSGSTSWLGSMYVAALRASAGMAELQADTEAANRYQKIAESGAKIQNETLWNGEYFIQIPDPAPQHDYNNGVCIDQALGQWWANQLDLGWIYPKDHVQSAMRALIKYNFHDNYRGIPQVPRKFAHDDDAGMQMCQWPKEAERPQPHVLYADEVWTGTEYSAAATMFQTGMMNEGLMIVKAAYDRYDGRMRIGLTPGNYTSWGYSGSPFIDEECGKFYARAMSVWSLLLAAQGFIYDGPAAKIGFAPQWRPDDHVSMFTAAEGYGLFTQKRNENTQTDVLDIRGGKLKLAQLILEAPTGKTPSSVRLKTLSAAGGAELPAIVEPVPDSKRIRIRLQEPVTLEKGQALQADLTF